MIHVVFIGIISACLTHFLNYCIGKPAGEYSPYEIFSGFTFWLSKKRLKRLGLLKVYRQQYLDAVYKSKEKHELITLQNDFRKIIYAAAEPFFTWERMVGMCPICFGFWVSLACGIFFNQNVVHLIAIIVISHVTIRMLNKIL